MEVEIWAGWGGEASWQRAGSGWWWVAVRLVMAVGEMEVVAVRCLSFFFSPAGGNSASPSSSPPLFRQLNNTRGL